MNFGELKTALFDRGFQHLSDGQIGDDINASRALLDELYLWPYRRTTTTGDAPLQIADFGPILAVYDVATGCTLRLADPREIADEYGTPVESGSPDFAYISAPGDTIATAPAGGTIKVSYFKSTPDLAGGSDTPLSPPRFHPLIVDMAAQRAYLRTDDFSGAQQLQPFIDQRLAAMVDALMGGQQIAGPSWHTASVEACDG